MTGILISPVLGPVCLSSEFACCYDESCQTIEYNGYIVLAEGPICGGMYHEGDCGHESCKLVEPEQSFCEKHLSWQLVEESGVSSGFAGRVYWANLACGCFDVDESDDERAAR
jgi:hypothetical protein